MESKPAEERHSTHRAYRLLAALCAALLAAALLWVGASHADASSLATLAFVAAFCCTVAATQLLARAFGARAATSAKGKLSSPSEKEDSEDTHDHSIFDIDAFAVALCSTSDPIAALKEVVGDIRTREADVRDGAEGVVWPCDLERYLARQLEEAGLFSDDVELPRMRVVMPRTSKLFYIRIEQNAMSYLAKLRVIQLESALNRTMFATMYFPDPSSASLREIYELNQTLTESIDLQATLSATEAATGEWAVRAAIAQGIEWFRLPYRLTADYRVNLAEHVAAFRIDLTPAEVFPQSAWASEVGRVVPTTSTMRHRAARDYALRLGILLAQHAIACAPELSEIWLAGTVDTSTSHACYYSVCFSREMLESLPEHLDDPAEVYLAADAAIDIGDGYLKAVQQTFSLEDERFCPPKRYEQPELSDAELDEKTAAALGTSFISGLSISEDARREKVASDIVRRLGSSTEDNVRAILMATKADPDITVRLAGKRTIGELLDGTLDACDPYEFQLSFVAGDPLSEALRQAFSLIGDRQRDQALATISSALDRIDAAGTYQDTDELAWRVFRSYTERILYNRLRKPKDIFVGLAPDSYFEAQLLVSTLLLSVGRSEEALVHARRCIELNPFDERAHLGAIQCLDTLERPEEALEQARTLLKNATSPTACGIGYYRLAYLAATTGDFHTAEACYRTCMSFVSPVYSIATIELGALRVSGQIAGEMDTDDIDRALATAEIPKAPTSEIRSAMEECAHASLDAEIFPVARSFAQSLGSFSSDDILADVIRSIEHEPDR